MALPLLVCSAQGVGNSTGFACQGELVFAVSGVAGGTTQLQMSPDDGSTWINFGAALTADGLVTAEIPLGSQVRANVATAGSVTVRAGSYVL